MSKTLRSGVVMRDGAVLGLGQEVDHRNPEGGVAVVIALDSQRPIDLMKALSMISEDQHLACTKFRDNWELGARLVADVRAGVQTHGKGEMSDEAAERYGIHTALLSALGVVRGRVAERVVLHNEPITAVGQKPLARFEAAIETIMRFAAAGGFNLTQAAE